MPTRNTFMQKPTVEIDQDRYEQLIRHELQYEQYRQLANTETVNAIEVLKIEEREDF